MSKKDVQNIARNLFVGHLLPLTLFTVAVVSASAVVTACSPGRGSTLKDGSSAAAQADLKEHAPAPQPTQSDLEKKLSGKWECSSPKNAAVPCFDQSLVFSDFLDKMSMNTFISIDDSASDKCHVAINYTLSVLTDDRGEITLSLGTATLGKLIADPSNAEACQDDINESAIPNLTRHQLLSHADDWKQITLDGITYSRPDPSKASQAEVWPSP